MQAKVPAELSNNSLIIDVDGKELEERPFLRTLDLRHNPLSSDALEELGAWTRVNVLISPNSSDEDEEEEEEETGSSDGQ
jgi:hypothetical protein